MTEIEQMTDALGDTNMPLYPISDHRGVRPPDRCMCSSKILRMTDRLVSSFINE